MVPVQTHTPELYQFLRPCLFLKLNKESKWTSFANTNCTSIYVPDLNIKKSLYLGLDIVLVSDIGHIIFLFLRIIACRDLKTILCFGMDLCLGLFPKMNNGIKMKLYHRYHYLYLTSGSKSEDNKRSLIWSRDLSWHRDQYRSEFWSQSQPQFWFWPGSWNESFSLDQ